MTLNRAYVFLDHNTLNPLQVDVNLKTLFDYLNSQAIGLGVAVSSGLTSIAITGLSQADNQYLVTVIPGWNTTYWITNKTTTGFTINIGTAPGTASTLDWRLMR